jgi:hypothetical protein
MHDNAKKSLEILINNFGGKMGVTVYIDDSKLFEKIVITFLMLSSNIFLGVEMELCGNYDRET